MSNPIGKESALGSTIAICSLILIVHCAGRVAAVCHPYKIDSFTYSVAAYKLWHAGATAADLVADKPPGQAVLTGWCYWIAPGQPTRLTLVPIESAFLIGAYAAFFLVARRLHGPRSAGVLTFFFVLAQSVYNALDFTTDGYNLNENYLALPMLTAVLAYLTIRHATCRGLAVGVLVGVALLIKQSASGLVLAILVSELVISLQRKQIANCLVFSGMLAAGTVIAFAPVTLYLRSKGWLGLHVDTLFFQTASHALIPPWTLPRWYNIAPLMPAFWVVALGIAHLRRTTIELPSDDNVETAEIGNVRRDVFIFLSLWLVIELAILAAMRKPASHYYQQIVAPVVLLSGFGLAAFRNGLSRLDVATRATVWRWSCVTTVVLIMHAAMPLFSAASSRIGTMDYDVEVREFAARVAAPMPPIRIERDRGDE